MKFFYFFVYSQKGLKLHELFHDGGRYHIETSCSANQWTSFYKMTASLMKELSKYCCYRCRCFGRGILFWVFQVEASLIKSRELKLCFTLFSIHWVMTITCPIMKLTVGQKIFWKAFVMQSIFYLKACVRSFIPVSAFVFLSFSLFLLVSHCFRALSKINLKVYDVISCLNKNLITYFVWYLEKKERYDIETLSNDRTLNKEHFKSKIIREMCTKSLSQTPFYFGKQPKTAIACKKFFQKQDVLKGDDQKPLKKLTLFFLSNPVSFNGQCYQK